MLYKNNYENSPFPNLLGTVVRRNISCKDATDIEDAAKDWLRYSCDQEGGRKERRQKKAAEEEDLTTQWTLYYEMTTLQESSEFSFLL